MTPLPLSIAMFRRVLKSPRLALPVAVAIVAPSCMLLRGVASKAAPLDIPAGTSRLSGARAVVVGGTSGIGHGIAARLAQAGASVTVVGRDAERGLAVVRELESTGVCSGHEFVPCDASILANAKSFAAQFNASHPGLDVLVLTQGIASMDGRHETSEGIDRKLALHYYSRVAFAVNLMPLLRQSARGGAVLSILSAGVHAPYDGYATDPELHKSYSLKNAADAAGFYNDCAWDAMSRQEEAGSASNSSGVTFIHAAPGIVATRWGQTDMPWPVRLLLRALMPLVGRSIYDCGLVMIDPLVQPRSAATSGSGRPGLVLIDAQGRQAKLTALQDAARDSVWGATEALLRRVGAWPDDDAAAQRNLTGKTLGDSDKK